MNFEEAKILARQGIKMTHVNFSPYEWIVMKGNVIIFEDGVKIFEKEWLGNKEWVLTGWSQFKQQTK
jgi:hypothetical protein